MPWTCDDCAEQILDDFPECPGCGSVKSNWTMVADQTRTFAVSRKKFVLKRREGTETLPAGEEPASTAVVDATAAVVLSKLEARAIAERGHVPAPADVLLVRLFPGRQQDLSVTLNVDFAERGLEELEFDHEGERPEGQAYVDVPFVFVFGEGDAAGIAFEGIHVVDLSNAPSSAFVPEVEFVALRKLPQELPTELSSNLGYLSVRFFDRSGTVALGEGLEVGLTVPGAGEVTLLTDAQGSVQQAGVPFADYELRMGEDTLTAPAVPSAKHLHRRHVPSVQRAFARLLLRDVAGYPLIEELIELLGPDGTRAELETDEAGRILGTKDLPPGEFTLRVLGESRVEGSATLELPTSPDGLAVVRFP